MTTVKEKFLELFAENRSWCAEARDRLTNDSADMYNASRFPTFWMQALAYMNLSKARDAVVAVVQHVGGELEDGDLKTKMLSIRVDMTEQEYDALIDWAWPLRNGAGPFDPGGPTPTECRLLYSAAKFLKEETLSQAKSPINFFLQREIAKGQQPPDAAVVVADFLRTQVTLEEWRGPYE